MFEAIVIGTSAGGFKALSKIIPALSKEYSLPTIIVQHCKIDADNFLSKHLNTLSNVHVKEARLNEKIKPGYVYVAPAGYHLLIERDKTFSLSIDALVNYAIPSIDVLFESAAAAYKEKLIGILLTGANSDGSDGLQAIKKFKGMAVVQDPKTADSTAMPESAIQKVKVDKIVALDKIGEFLNELNVKQNNCIVHK